MGRPDGAEVGFLDQILRRGGITGQPAGKIVEGVEVAQRLCGSLLFSWFMG
jgi:hypothetical protein